MRAARSLWCLLLAGCSLGPSREALLDPDRDGADWPADCASDDPSVGPSAEESPYDGVDNDCDPDTPDDDLDGDGYAAAEDCDDADSRVWPGAEEICGDGAVNDCDTEAEAAFAACAGAHGLSEAAAKWTGEVAVDRAGWAVAAAGDTDGDGGRALLIGAYLESSGGGYAGAAYLVSGGGAGGSLSEARAKLVGEAAGDLAGHSVAGVGDADGDGRADLLIGASGADSGAANAGGAYLVLGGVSGTVPLSLAAAKLSGEAANDGAGGAVAGAGDVDGDGLADLLVGASGASFAGEAAGAVYLVLGGVTGPLSLSEADARLVGEAVGDQAGAAVAGAGDVDGDGLSDLLIGAFAEASGGVEAGAAWLVLGGVAGGLDLADADAKLLGEAAGDEAGWSVAGVGDVDEDGQADLLIGAEDEDSGGRDAGAAYLLLGAVSGAVSLAGADAKLVGEANDDEAGVSVAGAGDVDGDGRADLLVGAWGEDSGGGGAGAAYLVLGGVAGVVDLSGADAKRVGEAPADFLGFSVSGAGDVNGDGRSDLLLGAYSEDGAGDDAGAAYLVLGGFY